MIERSCRIKAKVVSRDERETTDTRAQLNFGHTLGHALEAATGYRRWTHGEAIAIGMCAAAHLSFEAGWLPGSDVQRVVRLIQAIGLPTRARGVSRRAVLGALRYDKKFIHGCPRWVLPTRIGQVVVTEEVRPMLVERVLARYII
jgi:3-dehydroquinate synthase